jgi:hypothetical protein
MSDESPRSETDESEWYWDLRREVAVPASRRGPFDQVLGPYKTRAEAESWKERVEERNTEWDHDDEEWDREPDPDQLGS